MPKIFALLLLASSSVAGFGFHAPRGSIYAPHASHRRVAQISAEEFDPRKFIGDVISLRILNNLRTKTSEMAKNMKEEEQQNLEDTKPTKPTAAADEETQTSKDQ